jgi:integrase
MYSFYNAGIRFGDLCCLRWENLVDGMLKYRMNKTSGLKKIEQQPNMYGILLQYVDIGPYAKFTKYKPTPHHFVKKSPHPFTVLIPIIKRYARANRSKRIFPIIGQNYSSKAELRRNISSQNVLTNRALKKIAIKADIDENVSFHIARHSFAQFALTETDMDIYSISKTLGHSDLKVTEQYLKSFDEEKVNREMDGIYDKL